MIELLSLVTNMQSGSLDLTPRRKGMIRSGKFCSPSCQSTEDEQQHDRPVGKNRMIYVQNFASWRETFAQLSPETGKSQVGAEDKSDPGKYIIVLLIPDCLYESVYCLQWQE